MENQNLNQTNSQKETEIKATINFNTVTFNSESLIINKHVIHQVVVSEMASLRQGTHKVKDRSEVRGGGRKPWKQKGTGRARAGSIRSPIWVGGGRIFGPKPERNYSLKVNKKVRRLALLSSLNLKSSENPFIIFDFSKFEKPSTKKLFEEIKSLNLKSTWKRILIINEDPTIFKSAQNMPKVRVNKSQSLLVSQIINADVVIIAKDSLKQLEERISQ